MVETYPNSKVFINFAIGYAFSWHGKFSCLKA